jgi:hypothetical protein
MQHVEELCVVCGITDVFLNTSDQMAFYLACGYQFLSSKERPPEKSGLVAASLRNALGGNDECGGKVWMKKRVSV